MAQQNVIKVGLEISDNGTLQVSKKQAEQLRKAIEEGTKASLLLSRGIADPKKEEALRAQVKLAKDLTNEINRTVSQSKAASRALSSIGGGMAGTMAGGMSGLPPGLERGTAAANTRGGTRDFARQAQGMGGLVHVYATFAANIWAVTAAFEALSRAFETTRLEESALKLSATMGTSMLNLSKDLRDASGQAISFKESMQFAAMGTQAGLSSKQLNSLVTAAKGAANVLGRDVNDAINRMIRGTVKMEQEILDELGIFVRAKQAYKEYAAANNLASEEALTQSERVQAYADAVEKASKKYAEFAKIKDPFSALKTTIADAGTELLNFANKGLTPLVQGLSESRNLVEALLLSGGLYLTKLAIPTLKTFTQSLFDTSALVAKAKIARENEISSVTAQLENLKHTSGTIDFSKVGTNLTKSINTALNDQAISRAISNSLSKGSENFEQNLTKALNKAAQGYMGSAAKAAAGGDLAGQQKWLQQAQLIANYEKEIIEKVKQRIASDTELTALMNKQTLTLQDQVMLETKLAALQKETSLETRAGLRAARGTASTDIANKITMGGIGGILTMEAFKGIPGMFGELTTGMTKFSKFLVILETTAKLAAKALTGLFSVLNWGLMAWVAWDLAILPLLTKFNLVTTSVETFSKSAEKLNNQNITTIETIKQSDKLLSSSEKTIEDRIQAFRALTNSVVEQKDALNDYIVSQEILNKMTGFDRFINNIKELFGGGIKNQLKEDVEKTKESLAALDKQSSGGTNLVSAFEKLNELTNKRSALNEKIIEDEKYISLYNKSAQEQAAKGNDIRTNTLKARQQELNLLDEQIKLEQKSYDLQFKKLEIIMKLKMAGAEIAQGIETGFRSVENIYTQDQNAYRYKNPEIAKGSQSSKALTARALNKEIISDPEKLQSFKITLDETRLSYDILKDTLGKSPSKEGKEYLQAFNEQLIAMVDLTNKIKNGAKQDAINAALDAVIEKSAIFEKKSQEADKAGEALQQKETQRAAARNKAEQERLRAIQRIEEWEKKAEDRKLNTYKVDLQNLENLSKLEKEREGFISKATQEDINRNKQKIIEQEKAVALAQLDADLAEAKRGAKGNKALEESIKEVAEGMRAEIEQQYQIKLKTLDVDNKLVELARRRAEYEMMVNAPAKRALELRQAELNAANTLGKISPEQYTQSKFAEDIATLELERAAIISKAADLGQTNPAQYSKDILNQMAELDLREKKLKIEKATTEEVRKREVVLGNLTTKENLITSILEKQEGRGIFNIDLIEQLANTKLTKIAEQISGTNDSLAIQQLQLEAMNVLYEKQLRIHEAMKRNFLDLTPDQMATVAVNEATLQVDRFRASMKDLVTGTFDAVYAGFDAGIEELTTKIMDGSEIKLKDLITTVRNSMAEEFRKLAADQMKLGVRQIGASIMQAITGKPTDLRTIEQQQLGYLQQIAANTSAMVMGRSFGSGSSLFDYTPQDGKSVSYGLDGGMKVFDEKALKDTGNAWVESTQTAAKEVAGITNGVLGNFGGTVMQVFNGLGGGIIGLLQPILSLMGVNIPGGMGGTGLLGSVAGIFGNIDLTSALGSVFGTSGVGGWISGLPSTIAGIFGFANGGVMTDYGPLKLNKYSKGGIADRPQLAMYGEGRQNEAYVPLPDNRSIPVTLNGGAGGDNVSFNITVNDNSTVTSSQEGESSNKQKQQGYQDFSKLIAQKVREEMVNQKRPGGLLYGG